MILLPHVAKPERWWQVPSLRVSSRGWASRVHLALDSGIDWLQSGPILIGNIDIAFLATCFPRSIESLRVDD